MLENLIVAELHSMDTGMTTDMTSSCIYKYKKSVPNNVVAYYCSVRACLNTYAVEFLVMINDSTEFKVVKAHSI